MGPTFWVALGSFVVGLVATIATIIYGEISRRQQNSHHEEQRALAEEQLRLAREQAEMRPDLAVYSEENEEVLVVTEEPVKSRPRPSRLLYESPLTRESPPVYQGPGPHGDILFRLHNDGKTTASGVSGWLQFEAAMLRPVDPDDLEFRSFSNGRAFSPFGLSFDSGPEDGFYEVTLDEKSLSPGTLVTYEIPVVFLAEGPARIEYSVVCHEGASTEGILEVPVPSLEERSRRLQVRASGLSDEELQQLEKVVRTIALEEMANSDNTDMLDSAVVYERLAAEGAEIPDYALHEALGLLQGQIRVYPSHRRSEEDIRKHGGMRIDIATD